MKLTAKQLRFIDEYLIDLNATEAAKRAGYSKKTAYSIGNENLKKPEIKLAIEKRLSEKEDAAIMKQDEILKLYTAIARGELESDGLIGMGKGYQEKTKLKPTTNERLKALESLAKINQMFIEKKEIEHSGLVQFVDDIS